MLLFEVAKKHTEIANKQPHAWLRSARAWAGQGAATAGDRAAPWRHDSNGQHCNTAFEVSIILVAVTMQHLALYDDSDIVWAIETKESPQGPGE